MWSFLLGFGAVAAALANGPEVRRTIARAILTGSDLATDVGIKAYRVSKEFAADFEDAFAEVRAERAQASEPGASVTASLQELRREIEELRAEISRSKT
jgi:uncharacterized protein YqfA (UPF0365 family)